MKKGKSVIDNVLVDEKTKRIIRRVEVGREVDSGHFPIIVELKGKRSRVI